MFKYTLYIQRPLAKRVTLFLINLILSRNLDNSQPEFL